MAAIVVVAAGTAAGKYRKKEEIEVQTGVVARQDLTSIVSGSGEIKPLNWVNVSATAYGQITALLVKEGQTVKRGQELARLESIQPAADVDGQKAALAAARADLSGASANLASAEAAHRTAEAEVERNQADAEKARQQHVRLAALARERLVSRTELDSAVASLRMAQAMVASATARVSQTAALVKQARALVEVGERRVQQAQAALVRLSNVLTKNTFVATIDGVVTNLPVHVGENVVMGIQNSPGSSLMTIADMSAIVAEVKIDETDIVNVTPGQEAEITIDALPEKKFTGRVTEIGNSAILRSTGQATSLSSIASQEAKDFKVVIRLDAPPAGVRPGFSTTAKIRTKSRKQVLACPIQAVTVRQKWELEEAARKEAAAGATYTSIPVGQRDRTELEGVFAVRNGAARFVTVKTGITGATEIELTGELKDGEEVVTGSFKVLRTLKSGSAVRVNNEVDRLLDETN